MIDTISIQLKVREVKVAPAPHVEKKKKRPLSNNSAKRGLFENNNEEVKTLANNPESCCERSFSNCASGHKAVSGGKIIRNELNLKNKKEGNNVKG